MGKSTAGDLLRSSAVSVLDTDVLAREATEIGQPALEDIHSAFGSRYFASDGSLNRRLLADLVFRDAGSRKRLEAILHPRIEVVWRKIVASWAESSVVCGAVVIPLLFEKDYQFSFDVTVCLACSANEQLRRLRHRGWSDAEITARNQAQWPVDQKIQLSRFLIWTEGSLGTHHNQWQLILSELGCGEG